MFDSIDKNLAQVDGNMQALAGGFVHLLTFADLLATVAIDDWDRVDDIDVMIGLDSWHPTRGTRLTGERNAARRNIVEEDVLVPVQVPPGGRRAGWASDDA